MTHRIHPSHGAGAIKRPATFNKVFRWHPAKPGDPAPATVEVVGSFTGWKPVALHHDRVSNAWQLAFHDLPGNCTHHYMLLLDGQPASDKHCDGLAMPETEEEKRYQLQTARGPRVFMLFSHAK